MISKTKIKERLIRKTNPSVVETLNLLRKQKSPFWIRVAGIISKPKRKSIIVNISKINKNSSDGDIIVVPGKVLGLGDLDHKITLAAVSASAEVKKKIKVLKIDELVKKSSEGKGVKIIM